MDTDIEGQIGLGHSKRGKLVDDRTFKSNQKWVAPTHGGSKDAAPKWSWYEVLFMLVPFGILSGKQE
jgi:hypothetical protein